MIQFVGIVAVAENGIIGQDGHLPWHLPNDLKYFRDKVRDKCVIMGRKTFEVTGAISKKVNIVLSRAETVAKDVIFITSIKGVSKRVRAHAQDGEEVFVIGGTEIYRLMAPMIDRWYLTWVYANVQGDTYFPIEVLDDFEMVSADYNPADLEHKYSYSFRVYERKSIDRAILG